MLRRLLDYARFSAAGIPGSWDQIEQYGSLEKFREPNAIGILNGQCPEGCVALTLYRWTRFGRDSA